MVPAGFIDATMRRLLRIVTWAAGGVAAVGVAYLLVAVAFALFPAPGRAQNAAKSDPPIYVCASLAHADLVLPLDDPLADWRRHFKEVAVPGLPGDTHLAFGWGDLRFFRETPTCGDVRLSTAAMAIAGSNPPALRVLAINQPADDPGCIALRLDAEGRAALIRHILGTLARDGAGTPQWQAGGSRYEAYYLAKGRYGPAYTCNDWASDALAAAGLPHASFAPFSFGVMWPLDEH
jgi:uncharacterized protein (TIGR02117 family)